jgi:hypothetical protein
LELNSLDNATKVGKGAFFAAVRSEARGWKFIVIIFFMEEARNLPKSCLEQKLTKGAKAQE